MIAMNGISKSFNGNKVLEDVQFEVKPGEIHALMGENGAGKSTLMKILTGIYSRDSGEVWVKGEKVEFKNAKEAEAAGIAVIHQELNILPDLTVAENFYLGNEQTFGKSGILKTKEMNRQAEEILSKLGLDVDVRTVTRELSVGKQQIIEIAKAVSSKAEVIIMDEPTAALTDREIETLFATVRSLQAKGVSFVYISHRMEEIFAMCDRITILRDGQYIGVKKIKETTFEEIVQMMVGRELGERFPKRKHEIGEVKMKVDGLARDGFFEGVSFEVRKGEIVGIAGLMGAGRTEVIESIFGYKKLTAGHIFIDGKQVSISNPLQAKKLGIGYVTEDRKSEGLILDFSVRDNMSLTNFDRISKSAIIRKGKENALYELMSKRLRVRTSGPEQPVKSLSGGNQQKVVISKWLGIEPDILFLDEPTRGVDVGAKKEIYNIINELAERGVAIVMISSELPEVIGMADRVLVMHEGHLMANLPKEDMTQERIMHFATGGDKVVQA
ncbi:sugar ABC transporter ATP-binding protein [Sporosarcina sp.]|uniref:sugar ABC transporter ATP-binding protein n=1 Tax=Sporosarcina sp. TaxID=49982 RepID=UPI0026180573|nr:sugar ABC transporter ATP-binding protein [Sporosarcina sp.]